MRRTTGITGLMLLATVSTGLSGCGGGGGDGGTTNPPPVTVASVTLSQDAATLVPNATVTLSATAKDASGATLSRTVTWTSSDNSRATVTSAGVVTGVLSGAVTITAASEGKSASATVTVKDGAVIGTGGGSFSALSGNVTVTVPAGALSTSTMLTAEAAVAPPADARLVPQTVVELGPSLVFAVPVQLRIRYQVGLLPAGPPERLLGIHRVSTGAWQPVAGSVVDQTGKTVTVSLSGFSSYGVLAAPFVNSVALSQTSATLNVTQTQGLSATPKDAANATLADRDPATWTSSNPAVASVGNTTGLVTALTAGTSVITATIEGKTGTANVTVNAPVATVTVTPSPNNMVVAGTQQLVATTRDAGNNVLTGKTVTWGTSNPAVATVSNSGLVTAQSEGSATITATSEGQNGTAAVNVTAPVISVTVAPPAPSIATSATVQLTPTLRDALSHVLSGRAIAWNSLATGVATVDQAGLVTGVAQGQATITATSEGVTGQATVTVTVAGAIGITSVAPATLAPGGSGTITGVNFSTVSTDHTLSVAGVPVSITSSTATTVNFTLPSTGFPCQVTKPVAVVLTRTGSPQASVNHPLAVATQRTLALGDALYLTGAADVACNQFPVTGGEYLITVTNTASTATSAAGFEVAGSDGTLANVQTATAPLASPLVLSQLPPSLRQMVEAENARLRAHEAVMAQNRAIFASNPSPVRALAQARANRAGGVGSVSGVSQVVGTNSTIRVPNLSSGNSCNVFTQISARTVYAGTKAIVVEDITAPLANQMDAQLTALGQLFDNTQFGILSTNFGNPLAMDSQLDNDGRIVMVFSPAVNAVPGIAGFVTACDFFPTTTFASSNVGEYFYAIVPTTTASTGTQAGLPFWALSMPAVVIHEAKHITANAERMSRAGGGPVNFEESWLEELLARHSEELFARSYQGNAWKTNANYAGTMFCDVRTSSPPPQCANWSYTMANIWIGLYNYYRSQRTLSLFGPAFGGDFSFYQSGWNFMRWIVDQYAVSEGAFLQSLVQDQTKKGVANVEARTGKTITELMMKWSQAAFLDDQVGVSANDPQLNVLSWNTRGMWTGMNTDFPGSFINPPYLPFQMGYGNFTITSTVQGGGMTWIRLSGTQLLPQAIRLSGPGGAALPSTVRMSIIRYKLPAP